MKILTITTTFILLLSCNPDCLRASQDESEAKVVYGLSLGEDDSHPVMITMDSGNFEGCFATGIARPNFGGLRINIKLNELSCENSQNYRSYEISSWQVADLDRKLGIKSIQQTPSQQTKRLIDNQINLYRKIYARYPDPEIYNQIIFLEKQKRGVLTFDKGKEILILHVGAINLNSEQELNLSWN